MPAHKIARAAAPALAELNLFLHFGNTFNGLCGKLGPSHKWPYKAMAAWAERMVQGECYAAAVIFWST